MGNIANSKLQTKTRAFPLIEAGGLSAHTAQGVRLKPVSAAIPNAKLYADLVLLLTTAHCQLNKLSLTQNSSGTLKAHPRTHQTDLIQTVIKTRFKHLLFKNLFLYLEKLPKP
jgi:hypothetical protein